MVDEYFQYLQSMDEDGSSGPGLVPEVINLFIANTNRILNDIVGLLSAPKTPFFSSAFVMSSWVLISSALLWDTQEAARELQQGQQPGASAQGVQLQAMMLRHFFVQPIYNCMLFPAASKESENTSAKSRTWTLMGWDGEYHYSPNHPTTCWLAYTCSNMVLCWLITRLCVVRLKPKC